MPTFDSRLVRKRVLRAIRGLDLPDIVEADEHLIESMHAVRESIIEDRDISAAARSQLQRLQAEYDVARADLLQALIECATPSDAEVAISALDTIHDIITEQIAFMEFQRRQRAEILRMHHFLNNKHGNTSD